MSVRKSSIWPDCNRNLLPSDVSNSLSGRIRKSPFGRPTTV
jgi:hypothetical protein